MSKRMVKRLHKTGRVSRQKARAAAKVIWASVLATEKQSGKKPAAISDKKLTATGSGSISLYIGAPTMTDRRKYGQKRDRAQSSS